MSMILQNLTTNSASVPVAKMSSTAATTGTGFNQTLSYAMNGTATAGAAAGAAANGTAATGIMGSAASLLEMLQAMISGDQEVAEGTEQEQGQKVDELLDHLLEKLQKMDDTITSDPALMQALQSWLVQVQQVLTGEGAEATAADATPTAVASETGTAPTVALPVLAQQADTLRFAVADAVSQVVEKLQAVQNGTQQPDPKLEQLMGELQNILQKASTANGSSSGQGDANQGNQQNQTLVQAVAAEDAKPSSANASVTATAVSTDTADDALAADTADNHQPVIVTAGQLAMRAENTPLTATVQPQATVNAQNFVSDMSKFMVNKMDIHQLNGVSEARIILNPENLGMIDIKITVQDGQVLAQFVTEKHGAKDMLEQQMAQLRSALQSQGLQVDKLEVAESSSLMSDMYNGGQGFESNAGQQQGRRSKAREEQNDDAILTAELNGELNEWREERREAGTIGAARMMNYGSTYVARA